MVKPPAKTEAITATQLETVAAELKRLSETLISAAETAKAQPGAVLPIYNWASCETGLTRIQAFANDAHKAKTLADLGNPRVVGQLKSRSTAKVAGRSLSDEEIDKLADEAKRKADEVFGRKKKK